MTPYAAHSWRVTVEVDNYEQARMIGQMLVQMHPRVFGFVGLDAEGEPLWSESGDPQLRPDLRPE